MCASMRLIAILVMVCDASRSIKPVVKGALTRRAALWAAGGSAIFAPQQAASAVDAAAEQSQPVFFRFASTTPVWTIEKAAGKQQSSVYNPKFVACIHTAARTPDQPRPNICSLVRCSLVRCSSPRVGRPVPLAAQL